MLRNSSKSKIKKNSRKSNWKTFGISVSPEQYEWVQEQIKGYTVSEYFRTLIRKEMELSEKKQVVQSTYKPPQPTQPIRESLSYHRGYGNNRVNQPEPQTHEEDGETKQMKPFTRSLNEENNHSELPEGLLNETNNSLN